MGEDSPVFLGDLRSSDDLFACAGDLDFLQGFECFDDSGRRYSGLGVHVV